MSNVFSVGGIASNNFIYFVIIEQLSIFSVVQFPNDECTVATDKSINGICLSAEDCGKKLGKVDGKCASGFGVCCMIS